MNVGAVARNYGEALFALATRDGAEDEYADLLEHVVSMVRESPRFRAFLDTPRVEIEEKKEVLRQALGPDAPEPFLRFLFIVLEKRRQRALPAIADAFRGLTDEQAGRVHASIGLAMEPDEALRDELVEELGKALGRDVVPTFRLDPRLLGGVVVRIGDRMMDGSLRRRLEDLRRELVWTGAGGGDGVLGLGAGGAAGASGVGEQAPTTENGG